MAEKLITLDNLSTIYSDLRDRLSLTSMDIQDIEDKKVDGARVSEDGKYLYLMSNGEDVAGPYGPFSGGAGGGGGTSSSAVMNLTNKSGWLTKSVSEGTTVYASFTWSSILDGVETGMGTLSIMVDTTVVETKDINQGDFTLTLTDYVKSGSNKITITITDIYGNVRKNILKLNFINYTISSNFDNSVAYNENITFTYKPVGTGNKDVHFLMDGKEFETRTISTSNREDSITIYKTNDNYPEDFVWHGTHVLSLYFTATVDTENVTSNTLTFELICYDKDNTTPIITSTYGKDTEIMQYSNIVIPYYVYNTASAYTEVNLYIDDILIQNLPNVSRELQTWTRRATDVANHVFKIQAGTTERTFNINVSKLDVDVHAEKVGLALHLSSEDRSNNESEESRKTWQFTSDSGSTINAEFENFSWGETDGWLKDEDDVPFLRLKDKDKVTIPYQPFSKDKKSKISQNGLTLEFEFKISSVFDYDTDLISCYTGDKKIGLNITAQKATLVGSITSLSSQYKENEHVRISFVINPLGNERFIYCYINGIISGVVQYSESDSFIQDPAMNITLGSPDAVLDIYRIRIYQKGLNRFEMVNNWIADMQNSEDLLRYFKENDIYDNDDKISLDKIKNATEGILKDLPYMVIDMDSITTKKGVAVDHLPEYKGEKLLCSGYYVNPTDEYTSFSWKNAEIDVQGTSSQAYPIKNFKIKFGKGTYGTDCPASTDGSGFIMTKASELAGEEVTFKKYSMRGWDNTSNNKKYKKPRSIETKTFVFKADFASSEGCNNVELVRYYNDVCTTNVYKTPAQKGYGVEGDKSYREGNSLVRQGIDGFPMIWFQKKGDEISFIGKYNFNNHKGTEEVYGLEYNGEEFEEIEDDGIYRTVVGAPDESWEVCDNNDDVALWRRAAGEGTTTTLLDSEGNTVTYDDYLEGDNLATMKEKTLIPLYECTYDETRLATFIDVATYKVWWEEMTASHNSVESWYGEYKLINVYDSADNLSSTEQTRRAVLLSIIKADIRETFNLTEKIITVSPEEDMLGLYGKGENAAHAFEVRFPSEWYDTHTEGRKDNGETVKVERFVELQKWVASTRRDKATNNPLESEQYGYTTDSAEYRLAKFKNELDKYFDVNDTIFYYIFTEAFLMIDSRVKNSFPTYFAITHDTEYKDPETGEIVYTYSECEDGDTIEEGTIYYDCDELTGEYSVYEGTVGASAINAETSKALYTKSAVMTKEETLDKEGRPLGRWCWLPYDMDTAIGINNEGLLVFDYSLEDTEGLLGSQVVPYTNPDCVAVFNGATSVFWNNLRDAFQDSIQKQYVELRNGNFRYIDEKGGDSVEKRYEDHQKMWSAAIFNEDAYYKYILPLLNTGENRLGMCLGSKEQQRKWWLFNRFRFLDSKYLAGDALRNTINFRTNTVGGDKTIIITPYIDLYIRMKIGEAVITDAVKTYANIPCSVPIPEKDYGDTESYIYSADQIKSIDGLNKKLGVSTLDISKATNLQYIDVAGNKEKPNTTLTALYIGENTLLRSIDARYCSNLGDSTAKHASTEVDLSKCEQLEEAYFDGTLLNSIKLPSGGRLRIIHLPSSITTLNIENQYQVEELKIVNSSDEWDTSNITTLTIRNVNPYIQQIAINIINGIQTGTGTSTELTFTGFDIDVNSPEEIINFINKLKTFTTSTLEGKVGILGDTPIEYSDYDDIMSAFTDVIIDCIIRKHVTFMNYDGTEELDSQISEDKYNAIGKVTYGGATPEKEEDDNFRYDFDGWTTSIDGEKDEDILNNITKNITLYPHFNKVPKYTVIFMNYKGTEELDRQTIYSDTQDYVEFTGTVNTISGYESATFQGWGYSKFIGCDVEDSDNHTKILNVKESKTLYAQMKWDNKKESIKITKNPDKMTYYKGETFDKTGMTVTVTKITPEGEVTTPTIEYTCDETTPITVTELSIVVEVDSNNKAYVTLGIAQELKMYKEPTKAYQETSPSLVDFSGMELEVIFSNGQSIIVDSGYDYYPVDFNKTSGAHDEVYFYYKGLILNYSVFVVETIPLELEDYSWELISRVSQQGRGRQLWNIGDKKAITIKRTAFNSTLPDGTYYYRIVAFDHNIRYSKQLNDNNEYVSFDKGDEHKYELPEGSHSTTFMLATDSDSVEKAFNFSTNVHFSGDASYCWGDKTYTNDSGDTEFVHKHRQILRTTYLDNLPEVNKYILNVTKGQSTSSWTNDTVSFSGHEVLWSNTLATQLDNVFLPSVYEIFGKNHIDGIVKSVLTTDKRGCNESDVSAQFEYYKLNSSNESRIKYNSSYSDLVPASWCTRSTMYCIVYNISGNETPYLAYGSVAKTGETEITWAYSTGCSTPCFNV